MNPLDQILGIDRCYCTTLRKASRRISQLYDHKLSPTGLRATQFAILTTIRECPDLAVSELADHLDLDRTTTGKNLRPLEKDGYVTVVASVRDGRSRTISLTQAGHDVLAIATPLWREAQHDLETINGQGVAGELREKLHGLRAG